MTATDVAALLPAVFRRALESDETFGTLLDVMARMLDPVSQRLTHLDEVFDVLCTDDRFVPLLAGWVDLDWLVPDNGTAAIPPGRLRLLVATSHELARERGTRRALTRFLETATGVRGFTIDEIADDLAPFSIRVHVPQAAAAQMALVARIVESEKPAYLTAEIVTP